VIAVIASPNLFFNNMNKIVDVTVGILSPGRMGASIMAVCKSKRRIWASDGRSEDSKKRSKSAGLEDVGSLKELARQSDFIFSIIPPAEAVQVAKNVREVEFEGVFVDLNAISPQTFDLIADIFKDSSVEVLDGSIIGPPVSKDRRTKIFLAGASKPIAVIKDLMSGVEGLFVTEMVGKEPRSASALKMSFQFAKISHGLFLNHMAYSEKVGILEYTSQLLKDRYPDHFRMYQSGTIVPKAWRFTGEMNEVAQSFAEAGMYDGYARAAEEFYSRLSGSKDQFGMTAEQSVAEVLKAAAKQQCSINIQNEEVYDDLGNSLGALPTADKEDEKLCG